MSTNYHVSINNNVKLDLSGQDVTKLDAIKVTDTTYHILLNNTSYEAEITDRDFRMKQYKVKINSNTYNVHIFNPLDALIKELGFAVGASKKINEIKAPMPGLILDINVKIGQEVGENEPLLILEAMKMENVIVSPRAGIIKSVAVEKGNAVEKNHLLIEFE